MSHRRRTRADKRNEHAEFEYPPRRMARRGDRWWVRRSMRGTWFAGPKNIGLYVDPACQHRYYEFRTQHDAFTFAITRATHR